MTLPLTSEQREIRAVARQFLDSAFTSEAVRAAAAQPYGFDEETWNQVAELGWPAMAVGEDHGGLAFGQLERCLLLDGMGRTLAPLPFLSAGVLSIDALALMAGAAGDELLAQAVEGERRYALVAFGDLHAQDAPAAGVTAASDGDGWRLDGEGGVALDAASADALVVVARIGDEHGLFAVERMEPGLTAIDVEQMDETRRLARTVFDRAAGRRLDDGGVSTQALQELRERGSLALAAEMAGAASRCVDMTVEYAKERRQFGAPIGSFQAIKHMCANMAIESDAAREIVLLAAEVADSGDRDGAALLSRAAATAAADAFGLAAATAVQVHGGIGFTEEHDAQLFFKRAHVSQRLLGSTTALRSELATQLET